MSSQAQQTSSSAATATTTENDAESSSNAAANNFPTNRIFIGNLATELEEFTIYKYCSAYGEITKCQVMKEPKTERSRGFGFITYAQCSSALAILNARPHYIGHHKINVKPAFPTSEAIIQDIAHLQSTSMDSQKTERLFVAFNIDETSRNSLAETQIFGFLSNYGVVKEIVQQYSSSASANSTQNKPVNDYWIVEYVDEISVDRCMARGAVQYFSGVKLHLKRVISEQDVLRRKRKLQVEEANRQAELERAATTAQPQYQQPRNELFPPQRTSLLSMRSRPRLVDPRLVAITNMSMMSSPVPSLSVPIPPPPPPAAKMPAKTASQMRALPSPPQLVPVPIVVDDDILAAKGYGYGTTTTKGGEETEESNYKRKKRDESWR